MGDGGPRRDQIRVLMDIDNGNEQAKKEAEEKEQIIKLLLAFLGMTVDRFIPKGLAPIMVGIYENLGVFEKNLKILHSQKGLKLDISVKISTSEEPNAIFNVQTDSGIKAAVKFELRKGPGIILPRESGILQKGHPWASTT